MTVHYRIQDTQEYETPRKNHLAKILFIAGIGLLVHECYHPSFTNTSKQLSHRVDNRSWMQYIIRAGDTIKCLRESEGITVNLEGHYYKKIKEHYFNFESRNVQNKDVLYAGDAVWLPDIDNNNRVGCDQTREQTSRMAREDDK